MTPDDKDKDRTPPSQGGATGGKPRQRSGRDSSARSRDKQETKASKKKAKKKAPRSAAKKTPLPKKRTSTRASTGKAASTRGTTRKKTPAAKPAAAKPRAAEHKAADGKSGARAPRPAETTEHKPAPRAEAGAAEQPETVEPEPESAARGRRARYEDTEDPHALGIGSRIVPPLMAYGEDAATPSEPPQATEGSFELTQQEVEAQIHALEARLDGMIRRAGGRRDDEDEAPPSIREQVGSAARAVVDRLSAPLPIERPGSDDGGVVDAVRELASSDYYIRQWGRIGMRNRSEEVDDFGLDPTYEKKLRPLFDFLYKRYFRSETLGVEAIPAEGRCLVVANHSGTVPFDGMMLRTAVRIEHPRARELRWLTEDFIYYLPFMGAFMNRIGAVRACQENAERLLKQGRLVGVFPEGIKGVGKLYRDRYRLQRFGRGGYIRLCLRTQTPLVPCAILGAEETNPMLYRVEYLSRAFGLPYIPVTPTFPWLGPLGLLPAPTKWRIRFGEPFRFDEYGPEAADDHVLVGRLSEQVRTTIQRMLDSALRERQSVWFG